MLLRNFCCLAALVVLCILGGMTAQATKAPGVTKRTYTPSNRKTKSTVTEFPCSSKDLRWTGSSGTDLVMLCDNNHVYGSENYGKDWKLLTSDAELNGQSDQGIVVQIHPVNGSSYILFDTIGKTYVYDLSVQSMLGRSKVLYDSKVQGTTPGWLGQASTPHTYDSITFDAIEPHLDDPNKALAAKIDPECTVFGSAERALRCKIFLFLTGVQGLQSYQEWKLLTKYDNLWLTAEWGTGSDNEFFIVQNMKLGDFKTSNVFRLEGDDASIFGPPVSTTPLSILKGVLMLQRIGDWMFALSFDHVMRSMSLSVSSDDMRTNRKAKFPKMTKEGTNITGSEVGYHPVDVREEIFINVYFSEFFTGSEMFARNWGATYVSGLHGNRYTLSLNHNRRVGEKVDFHRVGGLDGIIVANRVSNPYDPLCRSCDTRRKCDESCKFESVITRDNGKTWQLIDAPSGMCDNSNDDCSLHLHGFTSGSGSYEADVKSLLSSTTAPGLVIGSGNVGSELGMGKNSPRSLFISHDGGETWALLSSGRHMYGETDYGGVLYLAPLGDATTKMNYSGDVGRHWGEQQILSSSLIFTDVLTAQHRPSAKHATFLATDEGTGHTHCVYVDLGSIKGKTCKSRDFEDFTPASYFTEDSSHKCLLGRRMTYKRKKQGANCWVYSPPHVSGSPLPSSFAAPSSSTSCKCTRDDYECDWFYFESGPSVGAAHGNTSSTTCFTPLSNPNEVNKLRCSSPGYTTYEKSSGYRKIGGDGCEGGMELNPVTLPCPKGQGGASKPWSGFAKFVAFVFVVCLLGILCRVLYYKYPGFKDAIDQVVTAASTLMPSGGMNQPYRSLATNEDIEDEEVDDDNAGANSEDEEDVSARRTGRATTSPPPPPPGPPGGITTSPPAVPSQDTTVPIPATTAVPVPQGTGGPSARTNSAANDFIDFED